MEKTSVVGFTGSMILLLFIVTAAVAQVLRPAPVLHELAGRDDCLMCHQVGAMEVVTDVPASHAGWRSGTCLWCHGPGSPMHTIDPPIITHDIAGRDDCLMCHAPGAMEGITDTPGSHEGRESSDCQMCHNQAD